MHVKAGPYRQFMSNELGSGATPASSWRPRSTTVPRRVAAAASSWRSGTTAIWWGARSAFPTSFFHIDVFCLTLNNANQYYSITNIIMPPISKVVKSQHIRQCRYRLIMLHHLGGIDTINSYFMRTELAII